jgi:hypothetical protein
MTNAATTGLTALPANLRDISVQSGIVLASAGTREGFAVQGSGTCVIQDFRSGEDVIVLPEGTDLASVKVTPDWDGDAWGLRIRHGDAGDSVFLRWGWKFDAAKDLVVADESGGDTSTPTDPTTPPTSGGNVELGTGADTLVLNVSSESYKGDAQFVVHVNGQQVGDVFTATAQYGAALDTITLHGDWGPGAEVSVTFVNDLWEGRASADRNLHIESASYNGENIEAAPQTVWGNYGVSFKGGNASGGNVPPPEPNGDVELGTGADTLVLKVSSDAYQGDAEFTVFVNGTKVGDVFTATGEHGTDSNTITLHGDWGTNADVVVTFTNDLWEGNAETDRNLYIDSATYNGTAIAGAAQTIWGNYGVEFSSGSGGTGTNPPTNGGGNPGGGDGSTPAGYSLVLADDFSNGYLYENWGNPFHGGTYWNGGFEWNAGDVGVRDGEMQVTMTNHDGWWTAGGFSSFKAGNTITYGKIEFDAKVPNYQGTMTAILTWPASDVWPHDGEIDILETPHNENMHSTHYAGPNGEHWYDSVRNSSFDAS